MGNLNYQKGILVASLVHSSIQEVKKNVNKRETLKDNEKANNSGLQE